MIGSASADNGEKMMGRSTPHRRLACSKCRERDTFNVLVSEGTSGFYNPTWFNVVAVARRGRQVICRCRTCGHEYATGSTAAHRAMDSIERFAKVVAQTPNAQVRGCPPHEPEKE